MLSNCDYASLAGIFIRLVVAELLLLAFFLKLTDRTASDSLIRAVIGSVGLQFSSWVNGSIKSTILLTEVLLSAILLFGWHVEIALGITALLLTIFTAVMLLAFYKGYRESCGCFGATDKYSLNWVHFVRNGIFITAICFAQFQVSQGKCIQLPVWEFPVIILFTTLVILIVVAMIYVLVNEIVNFDGQTLQ